MITTPGTLYIISAPSGTGKSSLIQALLVDKALGGVTLSISHTTRSQRPGEVMGEHYHFVDVATFTAMVEQQAFIEYAKVFGHYYGTARATVEQTLNQGSDVFLDIDWQGARQVREKMGDVRTIFILPPSRAALDQRLRLRGQDSEAVIVKRMRAAAEELSHYGEYDYLLVNDNFSQALADLKAVICVTRLRCQQQQTRCRALLRELLAERS